MARMTRDERLAFDLETLATLVEKGGIKSQIKAQWYETTGRKGKSFYNRLAELPKAQQDRYEAMPDGRTLMDDWEVTVMMESFILKSIREVIFDRGSYHMITLEELRSLWIDSPQHAGYDFDKFFSYQEQKTKKMVNGWSSPPLTKPIFATLPPGCEAVLDFDNPCDPPEGWVDDEE